MTTKNRRDNTKPAVQMPATRDGLRRINEFRTKILKGRILPEDSTSILRRFRAGSDSDRNSEA